MRAVGVQGGGIDPPDPSLSNADLAPTRIAQRTWTTYNIASLWVGLSVCIPTYMLAASLIGAGMIVLGKTHTVEFAMGSFGTNTHLGTPRNPWDLAVHRTPGGSSSGSAVAVASGLAPAAIGTDTGGSVRLPAAWCGIVGLKVTAGRISTHGVLPLSSTLDTRRPRNASDIAASVGTRSGTGIASYSITLGTRYKPPVTAGASRW